jgi:hypothetical protein
MVRPKGHVAYLDPTTNKGLSGPGLCVLVFDTDGALRDISCNAFGRMAVSIVAQWFVPHTMEHIRLYRFKP